MNSKFNSELNPRRIRVRTERRGQALLEFAIISLALYLLIGATITFGLWFFLSGQIQQAASVGARELSQTPLPGNMTFEEALNDPVVRARVYDDRWLVIDLNVFEATFPDQSFFEVAVPLMPLLNQQLALTYILDENGGERLLRYPGAVLNRDTPVDSTVDVPGFVRSDLVVQVPLVESRGADGAEAIRWLNVVEEIDNDSNPDPFQLFAIENGVITDPEGSLNGVVALRINCPAQSPWLSSFANSPGTFPPPINAANPNGANDGAVVELNPEDRLGSLRGEPLIVLQNGEPVYTGTYGGNFGLGVQGALTSEDLSGQAVGIRPYRRVLVSHAVFRREMYQ